MINAAEINQSAGKARVLVIEDDDDIVYILKFMLEKEGFEVFVAQDGEVAEQMLEELSTTNLILLDMVLPFRNGMEILRNIKSNDKWANVPVIMLSSKDSESDVVNGLKSGAEDYVTKPFSPVELMTRLQRFI